MIRLSSGRKYHGLANCVYYELTIIPNRNHFVFAVQGGVAAVAGGVGEKRAGKRAGAGCVGLGSG